MAEGQAIDITFKEALQKLLDRENFTHAQMLEIRRNGR